MEQWRKIEGYEEFYEISSEGRIRGLRRGMVLKPQKRRHGYLCIELYKPGCRKKKESIHRLVAKAFVSNPNNLPEINHKDECKTNNRASNLEWVTRIENVNYGTCQKRRAEKVTNGKRSRRVSQYTRNGELVKTYPSLAEAERQTGYAKANICRCAQGDSGYSHAYGFIWRYASE